MSLLEQFRIDDIATTFVLPYFDVLVDEIKIFFHKLIQIRQFNLRFMIKSK